MNDTCFLFWTHASGLRSMLIQRVTGDTYSHVGIGFATRCGEGYLDVTYYEALFEEGVVGPLPWNTMTKFYHTKGTGLFILTLPLSHVQIERLKRYVQRAVKERKLGYSKWQLLSLYVFERIGRRFGLVVKSDPSRVVCSEFVTRALQQVRVDLRDNEHSTPDSVTPGSARRAAVTWLLRKGTPYYSESVRHGAALKNLLDQVEKAS